jgi:hypothetical protein
VIDYPAGRWDESVTVGDTIDAVIRSSFFGDEYDGLAVSGSRADAASPAPSTSPPVERDEGGAEAQDVDGASDYGPPTGD